MQTNNSKEYHVIPRKYVNLYQNAYFFVHFAGCFEFVVQDYTPEHINIPRKKDKILKSIETVAQRCSVKEVFLEISQNFLENTSARASILIKLQAWWPETCNFIKKDTQAQVLSCKICEISKNTFSYRTSLVVASKRS